MTVADNRRGGNPLHMFHERVPVRREPVPLVTDAPPEPQPWQEGLVRDPLEALPLAGRV